MVRQKSGETAMASPTPSLDSLNGVLAMCGESADHHGLDSLGYSHSVFPGLGSGSSSGVSSATSSSSSASSLDRASTGSASSTSGQSHQDEAKSAGKFQFNAIILVTKPFQYLINYLSYQLHKPF